MFFGQQFDCSLRTDRSTKFGRSWTLICSNQVLTACGLHCLIIIFNGSWGCPLIAGERKTVAYSSYTVTKVLCMLLEWHSVLIIDASSKKLSLAVMSFSFYAREHTRYSIKHFALVFRYSCVARLGGHSSRNLDKPLIIHRRRNKQVSCLCSSENVSLCVTVHRQTGQITKSIVQLYIFYTHSY